MSRADSADSGSLREQRIQTSVSAELPDDSGIALPCAQSMLQLLLINSKVATATCLVGAGATDNVLDVDLIQIWSTVKLRLGRRGLFLEARGLLRNCHVLGLAHGFAARSPKYLRGTRSNNPIGKRKCSKTSGAIDKEVQRYRRAQRRAPLWERSAALNGPPPVRWTSTGIVFMRTDWNDNDALWLIRRLNAPLAANATENR